MLYGKPFNAINRIDLISLNYGHLHIKTELVYTLLIQN
jgi:hypothetical protein